jgi:spore maturation protein CgeB
MAKILLIDTCYAEFLKTLYINPAALYQSELDKVLFQSFGTGDFYSRNLRALGWDARDVIANSTELQNLWSWEQRLHAFENHEPITAMPEDVLAAQIQEFAPDVVFLQDLSLKVPKGNYIIAGQCSCPMPSEESLRQCDVIFTSFPHYLDRFQRMGIKAVFNPLAFDPIVLERAGVPSGERIHDVVFIGGVGAPSHWRAGMETLEYVASHVPTFKWWGYGVDTLPASSALRDKYQGEAWGLDMYRILLQSKITLNRHGEVANGYANNMRMFEATGCGSLLLTERSLNLHDYFSGMDAAAYGSPEEAVYLIERFLNNPQGLAAIAANGQKRTLERHTYARRMETISETLKGMLCPA